MNIGVQYNFPKAINYAKGQDLFVEHITSPCLVSTVRLPISAVVKVEVEKQKNG